MLNNIRPQWVAVYVYPRHEKAVAKELELKGYEVYLPLQRLLREWHDRRVWKEFPLFTSYLFVRISANQLFTLEHEKGVSFAIRFNDTVGIVSDEEIYAIRKLIAAGNELHVKNINSLKKGSKVRVLKKGYENVEGVLITDNKDGNFGVKIEALSVILQMTVEEDMLENITEG